MRILLADDAAPLRALFGSIVRRLGHEVIAEAADTAELLRLAATVEAEAVVVDGRLPPGDALSAVAQIRALLPGAAILIVAALRETALVREALQAGATGAIARPFQFERVAASLAGASRV